jgi:hypothetical protein
VICDEAVCGAALEPHGGQALAWLGGSNGELSNLTQEVTLPAGQPATLSYAYRIESEEVCGYDVGYVRLQAGSTYKTLRSFALCAGTSGDSWKTDAINLNSYAGQTVRVSFYVVSDAHNISSFFVDDAALRAGAACAGATLTP